MSKIRLLTKNNIRVYLSDMTDISNIAIEKHKAKPLAALVLGTAISVFGPLTTIKRNSKTSAIVNGGGPLGTIIVDSNDKGGVRASISDGSVVTDVDDKDPNLIPISIGVGSEGELKILQTSDQVTFSGEVKLVKGDIVTDMIYYYDASEQIKTAVVASVLIGPNKKLSRAYSILFQMLPGYTEEDIEWVEGFIAKHPIINMSLEEYEAEIKGDFLEEQKVEWSCSCEKTGFQSILSTLSEKEKQDIIKEHGAIEITCDFCKNSKKFKE